MAGRGAGQQAKACGANGGPRKLRGPCLLPSTRKHGPRAQNRRDGAPKGDADHEAASHVAWWFATCYPVAPIGAPFPSVFEGHPGKMRFARRRDADGAWAKSSGGRSQRPPLAFPGRGAACDAQRRDDAPQIRDPSAERSNAWAPDLRSDTAYRIASGERPSSTSATSACAKQVSASLACDCKHRVVPANAGTHNLRSRGSRTAPASRLVSAQRMGPCVRRDDAENGATAQPAMRPGKHGARWAHSRQLFQSR